MPRKPHLSPAALPLFMALFLAACGDDGEGTPREDAGLPPGDAALNDASADAQPPEGDAAADAGPNDPDAEPPVENALPVFTSLGEASLPENQLETGYVAEATDADGDALRFRVDIASGQRAYVSR